MVDTNLSRLELLTFGTLREVVRSPGPCITILLPPYHPGEPAGSASALLKSNLREATRQLAKLEFPQSAGADLLEPLDRLVADPRLVSGSHSGCVIFRSPSVFEQFGLIQALQPSFNIGGSFAIRKLAPEFAVPRVFYILALSKTRIDLLRCSGLHAEPAKPPGLPDTLAEALALEFPDPHMKNRSAAGSSTGARHSVTFGTGTERETEHSHLADYYKLVDRRLHQFCREPDAPLILAGVEEDTVIYRDISTYRDLVKNSIQGSPDVSREPRHLLQQAYSILRSDALERHANALKTAKESVSPNRYSADPEVILRGAFEGRVGELYTDENSERIDLFERDAYRNWGKEDVLNLAAVQTILHHGKSFELPRGMMPEGAVAVGLMRF
jgi:hypothetical protein